MHYASLGRNDIQVSRICLGTMTYGHQNTEGFGFWAFGELAGKRLAQSCQSIAAA